MSVQFVEYLQSSGTQYIDTGFIVNQNTWLRLDFEFVGPNYVAGARFNATTRTFTVTGVSGPKLSIDFGTVRTQINAVVGTRHVAEIKSGNIYCDGVLLARPGGSFQTPVSFVLFGCHTTSQVNISPNAKIYRATLFQNGVMIADYRPAIDGNGIACMYDAVLSGFVYNTGTGDFVAGPDIPQPTLDKKSFLSGVAVGRQLKGWSTSVGGVNGHYYVSSGFETRINNQGADEYNTILCDAGVRFALFQTIPNASNMILFAASDRTFNMVGYSYRNGQRYEEPPYGGDGTTPILLNGRTYYYAYANWRNPVPQQELPCDTPVIMTPGTTTLTNEEILCNGIIMTYGGGTQRPL